MRHATSGTTFDIRPEMRIAKNAMPLVLSATLVLCAETDAAAPTDLYLLVGQSNMAGRGALDEVERIPTERVWKFTLTGEWAEAVEPVHFDRPTAGAGPGLAFGRAMADAAQETVVGLIPCAVGNSPLSRWEPGGDLYSNAVARTRDALATGGRLRGILWHQGEADSWSKAKAESYAQRLTNMVTRLREDLGETYAPFIAGEVGAHYAESIARRGGTPFVAKVNEEMKQAVALLPAAGWVSAEGLAPGPDGIHFDAPSAHELGRRYARELLRWRSVPGAMPESADFGGAEADWKPPFIPRGFNLHGMRWAGPNAGFDEDHFRWIADWGFNFVRLPLDYRNWVKGRTSENRESIDEAGLKPLDEGIAFARKHGLATMICLHRIPGEYSVKVRDPEPGNIYTDPDCLRAAAMHWAMLARRYRGIPRGELIFNLINEPSSKAGTLEQYEYVCRVLIAAIRREDPGRFVVIDGWAGGKFPVPGLYGVPGVGQATRGYYPYSFSHFGVNTQVAPSGDVAPPVPPRWPPDANRPDGRLGGPVWTETWHAPFVLRDAPAARYRLALGTVSGPVTVSIAADGAPAAAFSLAPATGDSDWTGVSPYRGNGGEKLRGTPLRSLDFALDRPAGELRIQVTDGDWAMPRLLEIADSEGETARLDFGGDMNVKANVRWTRRFAGWDAPEPMPPADPGAVPRGRFADEGMNVIFNGYLGPWEEPLKAGVWCMVGEFGCANHVAHADAMRFLESNLSLYEELGLGWCLWGFGGSRFGILNSERGDVTYEDWHGRRLDRDMLELLRRHAGR